MYSFGVALAQPSHPEVNYAITAVVPYRFARGTSHIEDPVTVESFRTAMLASGVVVSGPRVAEARGNSFSDMAKQVMSDRPPVDPSELVIVAHTTPDVVPSDAPSIKLLALQRPTASAAFTLCDEGPSIAFTAIEIARHFAARQGYDRVSILVVENSTFPYEPRVTEDQVVLEDAAVLFVLEPSDSATIVDRLLITPGSGVDAMKDGVIEVVAAVRRRLLERDQVRWVLGSSLSEFADAVAGELNSEVVVSTTGQPGTSIWFDAVRIEPPAVSVSSVVVDFDASAGALVACHFRSPVDPLR